MNSHKALGFGDFCRRRFGDFHPELVLISNQERGGKHWKSKYNVRPSISLTYAWVLRRMRSAQLVHWYRSLAVKLFIAEMLQLHLSSLI